MLEWNDAWILLAVLMSGGAAQLSSIIGTADYINHAIPTREELQSAFTRLNAAGLVRKRKAGFIATDLAIEVYAEVVKSSGNVVRSRLRDLRAILACPSCGVSFRKPRREIVIEPEEYDDAVAAYRGRFAAAR